MRRLLVLVLLALVGTTVVSLPEAAAQAKQSRIPRFITDAGAHTGNFRESANFVVRWGDAVDVIQWARVNRGIDDYPAHVLDVMERTYTYYKNTAGFHDPDSLSPGKDYKINLYLCGSWRNNFLPPANWAGTDEIGVGHICLPYDKYWDDWVESHEYNHVLQAYASQRNRANGFGGGFGFGNPNSGRFWEAHANFMARMRRPEVVIGSGYFGSRHHYRWLDQMTYYGDWLLLNKIRDTYGLGEIHRLWYEARHGEHPIQAIKRLYGLDHTRFAELIGDYARRNVVYDYADGARIRSDVWRGGGNYRPAYTVSLETVNQAAGDYRIPAAKAPQQYGYNLIQLNPTGQVTVRLTGNVNPSLGSDWRFSLVAVRPDFSARYGPRFGPNQTATFQLQPATPDQGKEKQVKRILAFLAAVVFVTGTGVGNGTAQADDVGIQAWNPPSNLVQPLDEVWRHQEATYGNLYGFRNYGWDQIMANRGYVNYCVRWDSNAPVSSALRDQIHAALTRQFTKWMSVMVENGQGWENWPYTNVPVKVVGWAVRNRSTLQWTDNSVDIYVNDINENAPQCSRACGRFFHQDGNYSQCPGGVARHYDMSLWLTQGMGGGAGGDWGQRMGSEYFVNNLNANNIHIYLHEVGHTFGLDDFYDWTPTGQCCFLMKAGSAAQITEFDKWMFRDWWRHLKSRYGL